MIRKTMRVCGCPIPRRRRGVGDGVNSLTTKPLGAVLVLMTLGLTQPGCRDLITKPQREPPLIVTVSETFELAEPGTAWSFQTPELWRTASEGSRHFLQMTNPPDRTKLPDIERQHEYAIYNKYEFRSFNLSCRVRAGEPSVAGADAVIIFGQQDPTHFYYLDLSSVSGPDRNTLVRVNGSTRQALLTGDRRPPTLTDAEWHKIDIQRDADKGTITVYIDIDRNDQEPLLTCTDRTYKWGLIGLGSNSHQASFGRLIINGEARSPTRPTSRNTPATTGEAAH